MAMHPAIFLYQVGTNIEVIGDFKDPMTIPVFPESIKLLRLLQNRFVPFSIPVCIHQANEKFNLKLESSSSTGNRHPGVFCGTDAGLELFYDVTNCREKHQHELSESFKSCENAFEASQTIFRNHYKFNLS